jgi:hypothetical protein
MFLDLSANEIVHLTQNDFLVIAILYPDELNTFSLGDQLDLTLPNDTKLNRSQGHDVICMLKSSFQKKFVSGEHSCAT